MTLSQQQQQNEVLNYLQQVVQRYKSNTTIIAWQVENEPLVNFGECPDFYWRKMQMLKFLFGKEVIVGELQAEPWASQSFWKVSSQEQEKTMSLQKFKDNILYAKQTGMDEFYLWGAEWWHWLKQTKNKPEIWNEAKKLF